MAAVGLSAKAAEEFLRENNSPVVVACDNGPTSVTLSGTSSAPLNTVSAVFVFSYYIKLLSFVKPKK